MFLNQALLNTTHHLTLPAVSRSTTQLKVEGMAASKFYVASCALLLIGVVLLGQQGIDGAVAACPQFCLDVDYVTCPSSGSEKLPASCNCCMTPKGCTLHLSDGTQQTCS